MEFGSFDGREDDEQTGVVFVEMNTPIFAMQGGFFFGTETFDRI